LAQQCCRRAREAGVHENCYQLDGGDTAAFAAPPAPTIAGTEEAAEMVEMYWAAQLRDHEFNNYDNDSLAQAAAEINKLPGYVGPRNSSGQVTTKELFRGGFSAQPNYFPGELTGPYVSQFAILPTCFGAQPISQQWQVFLPVGGGGADYMTDAPAQGFAGSNWLNVQNGAQISTLPQLQFDPVYRYPRNGRDWSAMTHVDLPPQEAFVALLVLLGIGAPVNPGSPYAVMKADNGFNTFGGPDFSSLVGQVAACALDIAWYSKWQVHLRHRPEGTGALAHLILTGQGRKPMSHSIARCSTRRRFTTPLASMAPTCFRRRFPRARRPTRTTPPGMALGQAPLSPS